MLFIIVTEDNPIKVESAMKYICFWLS